MTISPGLAHGPAAPAPLAPAGGSDGFVDCRGQWHSWTDEEDD